MRLLICAGGTGGGVFPALTVLEQLTVDYADVEILWVGGEGGMEADLVAKSGLEFVSIPAAGVHGVGIRRLPGNIFQLLRGIAAGNGVLKKFQPDIMFFTGGYVAVPIAIAGLRIPSVLFVPDIEPGLALKVLSFFADRIAVTVEESTAYFSKRKDVAVTGYPVRKGLSSWKVADAYHAFDLSPELPTLLVTGGSLGSLSINKALVEILPELLAEMQVIHLTGRLTWSHFKNVREEISPEIAPRYRSFPFLHEKMGAAFTIADLVVSRAGASSIGEYPYFGLPAILVPYPYAWRYQKVNADYLVRNNAAILLNDADMPSSLLPLIREIMRNNKKRMDMKKAMRALAREDAAKSIAKVILDVAALKDQMRN